MKKLKISVVLLVIALLGMSQDVAIMVPSKVSVAFKGKYPKVEKAEWKLDDDVYVVVFSVNEIPKEAEFEKSGKWLETRSIIALKTLSEEWLKAIVLRFPNSKLDDVTLIEKPNSKSYEVGLMTKDDSYVVVTLNEKGKITDVN